MRVPHPVVCIVLLYMCAQSVIVMLTTGNLSQLRNFMVGSLFLLGVVTVLLLWTGDLFIKVKLRKKE
jgi:hypothetical protein